MKRGVYLDGVGGFSLIETLAALALAGLVMGMLGTLTAQWFPTWNAGFSRLQKTDLAATALDRVALDLAAAEFLSPDPLLSDPFFDGAPGAVTFVRRTLGPSSLPGLEIVRLTEASDAHGSGLLRARSPFTPALKGVRPGGDLAFDESVFVLRGTYHWTFAYGGHDGLFRERWTDVKRLPAFIRVSLSDGTGRPVALATTVRVHVTASPACARSADDPRCVR